jgi:hypothetical protein
MVVSVYVVTHFGGTRLVSNGSHSITTTTGGDRVTSARSPQPVAIPVNITAGTAPQNSTNAAAGQGVANAPAKTPVAMHPVEAVTVAGGAGGTTAAQKLPPGVPYRAAPTEATIIEEQDENGGVTYKAAADPADSNDRAALLQDIVKNHGSTASAELLQLFEQGQSVNDKNEILSYATQIPSDQNTLTLLEAALGPSQPADLRLDAVTYAADQEPDMLLHYIVDPTLGIEVQSVFINATYPDAPVTISGTESHPPLGKTSTPPADANQSRSH